MSISFVLCNIDLLWIITLAHTWHKGYAVDMYGYTFHADGTRNGDKKHLSYSAIDLFRKGKNAYRKRYYIGEPAFTSPFIVFGTEVHRQVEHGELEIKGHPAQWYDHEVKVRADIDGVQMLGCIDMLEKHKQRVVDIKTSINPWTLSQVQALDQLPLYVLMLRENGIKASQYTGVLWLETQWCDGETITTDVSGFSAEQEISPRHLELTGKQVFLRRRVLLDDLDRVRGIITSTAKEIAEDFEIWKKNN